MRRIVRQCVVCFAIQYHNRMIWESSSKVISPPRMTRPEVCFRWRGNFKDSSPVTTKKCLPYKRVWRLLTLLCIDDVSLRVCKQPFCDFLSLFETYVNGPPHFSKIVPIHVEQSSVVRVEWWRDEMFLKPTSNWRSYDKLQNVFPLIKFKSELDETIENRQSMALLKKLA